MDSDQCSSGQELVKVVVVGDNGVGKTRLVCARAYMQSVPMSQLLKTHVPTIWAIDQYRIYKEVLEKSWVNIDGVDVGLRLWDTFGDHHKDRRFAYERSDVIIMCFDAGRIETLDNCRNLWQQQIKQFCPDTPIMLVGCKNDLRYMYGDQEYIQYCKERRPFVRQVLEKDLLLPQEGRSLANELGIPYYETSVYTFFGVTQVFENAARAALCARRTKRFWKTNLKNILKPLIQEPFCPPRPSLPQEKVDLSGFERDLQKLHQESRMTDLIFVCCGSIGFSGHKFFLSSVCPILHSLLTMDLSSSILPLSTSPSQVHTLFGSSTVAEEVKVGEEDQTKSEGPSTPCHKLQSYLATGEMLKEHTESLYNQSFAHKSSKGPPKDEVLLGPGVFRQLNHPAFQSIHIQQCQAEDQEGNMITSVQTVLTCSKLISPSALSQVLRFLYTGTVDLTSVDIQALKQAAEFLGISDLLDFLRKPETQTDLSNNNLTVTGCQNMSEKLEEVCLTSGLFSDVLFRLDDGVVGAHKAMLMARCDMMAAMFSDNFLEGSAEIVDFPGVTRFALLEIQYYLYTDKAPRVTPSNCLAVLELANRLVLPRLVTLIENKVIQAMREVIKEGDEVFQDALEILQPSQIHNAHQLAKWCFAYLGQNYNNVCRSFPKVMKSLCPENQALLNLNRWPPIWYVKDFDLYERLSACLETEKPKTRKRQRIPSACLCFTGQAQNSSYNLAAMAAAPTEANKRSCIRPSEE